MRPNFLMIGAAKAGTTFLAGLLAQHPQIAISNPKEPKFFSTYWNHGWDWYRNCFVDAAGRDVLGDASTQYSILGVYPQALDRIAQGVPGCPNHLSRPQWLAPPGIPVAGRLAIVGSFAGIFRPGHQNQQ